MRTFAAEDYCGRRRAFAAEEYRGERRTFMVEEYRRIKADVRDRRLSRKKESKL